MVALTDSRFLSVGCGAWVAVLVVLALAGMIVGRRQPGESASNED
jgi:hypothetical protein